MACLGLIAREARCVKDEHDVKAALGGVCYESLEFGPSVGLKPR
jgi:hypothetical protein